MTVKINKHFKGKSKPKIIWVYATKNILWSTPDIERADDGEIKIVTENELQYFETFVKHMGPAGKYQILGEFLKGQKVPGLRNVKLPAIRGKIQCRDFEAVIDEAKEGDFVFVDPSYTVRHNMNGFVKFNQKIFAWHDQIRLRDALQRAADRDVSFAMTNADQESIRDLYAVFGEQRQLGRHSVIAGQSVHRAHSTELLVTG